MPLAAACQDAELAAAGRGPRTAVASRSERSDGRERSGSRLEENSNQYFPYFELVLLACFMITPLLRMFLQKKKEAEASPRPAGRPAATRGRKSCPTTRFSRGRRPLEPTDEQFSQLRPGGFSLLLDTDSSFLKNPAI